MKKIFSLFIAALCCASMFADITVRAKVPTEWGTTISAYTWTNATDGAFHETTYNSGWYTYTYTGDGPIKVIFVNGTGWGTGDKNQTVDIENVTEDSYYKITYVDANSKCNATPIGYYIGMHANFLGDKDTDSNWETRAFDISTDKETATLKCDRDINKYLNFGMRIGSTGNWTSNGTVFARGDAPKVISSGSGECYFQADMTGEYTFTWNYVNSTLTITYPEIYNVKLYFVNVPGWDNVLVYAFNSETSELKKWPGDPATPEGFMINGKDVYSFTMPATYEYIIFHNGTGDQTEDLTWDAAKPYFYSGTWYTFEGAPTAVENVADEAKAIKRIENGQLVIYKNGVRYNALGAEVK